MQSCPLCNKQTEQLFYQQRNRRLCRDFYRCEQCDLVFVPPSFHLDLAAEKAEYDLHDNQAQQTGYRQFLGRAVSAAEQVKQAAWSALSCLDFGSGPQPVLAGMLQAKGAHCAIYDKFYAPQTSVLKHQYDMIFCTEVIEHIFFAQATWQLLNQCLGAEGQLLVMTKRVQDQAAFARWHYINDPTHICFYSIATFEFVAAQLNRKLAVLDSDIIALV